MSISAPPSAPSSPLDRTEEASRALLEQALIEEARRRARRRRRRYGAAVLLAVGGALIAFSTGIRAGHGHGHPEPPAAPTRSSASGSPPRPAPASDAAITILHNRPSGASSISILAPRARTITVWRCPHNLFCGELVSATWAPDGRRLAISLTQFGGQSPYPGLHIIDTATGHDRLISAEVTIVRSHGCDPLDQMAWSPDGSHIAYVCEVRRNGHTSSQIRIMNADGTHPQLLPTGTAGSAWPSWSPDGTRIAFSTARSPGEHLQDIEAPAVYSVGLNGDHRRLLATDGVAPSWSPDGSAIAYRSACGRVRLAAPDGRDITPPGTFSNCVGMGPAGWPAWAPDGSLLAIATTHGLYLIRPDGSHARRINRLATRQRCCPAPAMTEAQIGGFVRPGVDRFAWRPVPEKPKR